MLAKDIFSAPFLRVVLSPHAKRGQRIVLSGFRVLLGVL